MFIGKRTVLLLLIIFLCTPAPSYARSIESLLDDRSVTLWFEGMEFGDMIIGARAQFAFTYVDRDLANAVVRESAPPEWLRKNISYFGGRETRGKALFIIRLRALKRMELQLSMIRIGTHVLTPEDLLTNRQYVPVGEMPPDFSGIFAVAVPLDAVRGSSRSISVGDYSTDMELLIR